SEQSGSEDEYKIDKLFFRICNLCFTLGINFYPERSKKLRCLSLLMIVIICSINIYFIGYSLLLTMRKPFLAERVATSIAICTWVLQATFSTIFLSYWQYASVPCKVLKLLYEATRGVGIHRH
ncbi:hypothetical protein PMAYCL1PPCAC_19741, partial [Pristionchus mayeri]